MYSLGAFKGVEIKHFGNYFLFNNFFVTDLFFWTPRKGKNEFQPRALTQGQGLD